MKPPLCSSLMLALLLLIPQSGAAQDQDSKESVVSFRSDVELASVAVRVSDRKDQEVAGLTAEQFSVFENNIRQKIAFFSAEQQPISLAILLDVSSSMMENGKLEEAKRALAAIVNAGHPDNEWLFLRFHRDVEAAAGFTHDRKLVLAAIADTRAEREGTSLYDAIAKALCLMRRAQYQRQALIVITDGADQQSHRTLDELIPIVQAARAQLFMVGCFGRQEAAHYRVSGKTIVLVTSQEIDNPHFVFSRLAQESGAEYYFPTSPSKLQEAVDSIARQLRTQYSLAYYPEKGPGYRHIEVKVAQRGVKVRARRGFDLSAVPASQPACEFEKLRPYPFEARVERKDGCIVYHEDFRSADTGWLNREHYFLEGGAYRLTSAAWAQRSTGGQPDTNSTLREMGVLSSAEPRPGPSGDLGQSRGTLVANGPWLKDVSAEVTLRMKAVGGIHAAPPSAGLAFRVNDTGYYAVLIDDSSSKELQFKLVKQYFGEVVARDLLPWTPVPLAGAAYASWHKVAVTCIGKHISVYIQGAPAGQADDAAFEEGMAGLMLFGIGSAEFQDLRATELCRKNSH